MKTIRQIETNINDLETLKSIAIIGLDLSIIFF